MSAHIPDAQEKTTLLCGRITLAQSTDLATCGYPPVLAKVPWRCVRSMMISEHVEEA